MKTHKNYIFDIVEYKFVSRMKQKKEKKARIEKKKRKERSKNKTKQSSYKTVSL